MRDEVGAAHEIHTTPSGTLRLYAGLAVAFVVFMAFLAGGCLLAVLTQGLDPVTTLSALAVGGIGVVGATAGVRGARELRRLREPTVVARLDLDGVHLREEPDSPDRSELPEGLGWTTVPWGWVSAVQHVRFDLRAAKQLGAEEPFELLRFVLADDRLLDARDADPVAVSLTAGLGLTPTQQRTTLLGAADNEEHPAALRWLAHHRPDLAVLQGAVAPWSTAAAPDRWAGAPRVAVVGAHGRLGRTVVAALGADGDAPPVAIVRNEAHRALLEGLGAEVRMVDLATGSHEPLAVALRGCAAVVCAVPDQVASIARAAQRAGVGRLLLVAAPHDDHAVECAAASGAAWTAFRPTFLTEAAATGEVALGTDVEPGPVPRGDLAQVIVAALRDEASVGAVWPIAGAHPEV